MATQIANQEILDYITKTALFYDLERIEQNSNEPDVIHFYYAMLGQGGLIADRIIEAMADKYPNQQLKVIVHSNDQRIEVLLMEADNA